MSNDDERDYAEEQFNRHLLDDEIDPEDGRDTPRLDALLSSEDPEEDGYQHYTPADLESDSFGTDPDGEEYTEAELDAMAARNRELMDTPPGGYTPRQFTPPGEGEYTRSDHRAQALADAGMAERSEPEFAPGHGFSALTHAVLALSAPDPETDNGWRERAIEAEAALTAIGGTLARQDSMSPALEEIGRILRVSGQQSDAIIARYRPEPPAGPEQDSTASRIRTEGQVRDFLAEQLEEDDMSLDEIAAEVTRIATGASEYEPR
jgi:hypothetical protein